MTRPPYWSPRIWRMNQYIHWHRAIAAHLALVLLLSLVHVSTGTAANKPNRNNSRVGQRAAAYAHAMERQIQVVDAKINDSSRELASNRDSMAHTAPQMQTARSQNEAAKLRVTNAKLERKEVEDAVLDSIPSLLVHKSAVIKARTVCEAARNKAETQIPFYVKGVEREKRITAIPAVQQAQQALKRATDDYYREKSKYLKTSPSWIGSSRRLNERNTEAEETKKNLNQMVQVYNKYQSAAKHLQRKLNGQLQVKQVLVVRKQAFEKMARDYGYNQRPGSKGSGY